MVNMSQCVVTVRVLPNYPLWDQGDASGVAGTSGAVPGWPPGSARDTARGPLGRARSRPFQRSIGPRHRGFLV